MRRWAHYIYVLCDPRDGAKKGRGDVVDSLGRVLFRDTLHGWLFVGQHRPVVDALRVTS